MFSFYFDNNTYEIVFNYSPKKSNVRYLFPMHDGQQDISYSGGENQRHLGVFSRDTFMFS